MAQLPPDPPTLAPPLAASAPRARRRIWRLVGLACLAPVVFVAVALAMLIARDITAPSWVALQVESRAAAQMDGGSVQFGQISLRLSGGLRPAVRLRDTRVFDRNGVLLTRIPVIEADLSPRGLFLRRQLLVQELRLVGAQINLRRARDGRLRIALGRGDLGDLRSLADLGDLLDRLLARPPLAALRGVQAVGVIVNYDDARARRNFTVDGGQIALDLRAGQIRLSADLALLSGGADVTTARLSYARARGSRAADLAVAIDDIPARDIAAQSPALQWLGAVDAPLSAMLRTGLDETGALGPLQASLSLGAGALQPTPAAAALRFSQARADLHYDPARAMVQFSRISLRSERGNLQGAGTAYLREMADGLPQVFEGQFALRDLTFAPPGAFADPPQIAAATADLRLRLDPFVIDIGQITARDGAAQMALSGRIAATAAGWQVALDAEIDQIAPARVLDFWPATLRPGVYRWLRRNLRAGLLRDARFGLRLVPDAPVLLAGDFDFAGATVAVLGDLPPVTEGAGRFSLQGDAITVAVARGVMLAPSGGQVRVDGSVFAIPDLREAVPRATLRLAAAGPLPALLAVMNQRPFRYLDRAGLPVDLAQGRAQVDGAVSWPLAGRPGPGAVDFSFAMALRAAQSRVIVPGRDLRASALAVDLTPQGLRVAGPVTLDGVAADVVWQREFARPGSQLRADLALSPAGLRAFGLRLPAGLIDGQAQGRLDLTLAPDTAPRFALRADLRGLAMALPVAGWAKPAAAAGQLQVAGRLGPVPEITDLQIATAGLAARGQITLAAGGGLDRAVFSRVQIGTWLDAPVTLRDGELALTGGVIDLRGGLPRLGAAGSGQGGAGGGAVTLALDRVILSEGLSLTGLRGRIGGTGAGRFQAALNGTAPLTGTISPGPGGLSLALRSADTGALLQAAGLSQRAIGGDFALDLAPAGPAGHYDGRLALRALRLGDAPAVAALLDAVSVVGLLHQLDGQGIALDAVDAQFRLTPQEVIVSQASATGPGLGFSLEGRYIRATQELDLQGVVSPFYLINSVGAFLTRRGEGLIGVSFRITGPAGTARISVNPLSALAVGPLRNLFRRPLPEIDR